LGTDEVGEVVDEDDAEFILEVNGCRGKEWDE